MSANYCSFTVFPMKVIFHCLLHEVNICDLKWDPESNILCAAYEDATVITGRSRVPAARRRLPCVCPAFPFIEVPFLISFDCFHLFRLCCDINHSFYFMGSVCWLAVVRRGWCVSVGFESSSWSTLQTHTRHKHKHNGESTPPSSSSVHIEL